jgi:hypothetical protein
VVLAGAAIGVVLLLLIAVLYLLNVKHYRAAIESAVSSPLGRQGQISHLHFSPHTSTLIADDNSMVEIGDHPRRKLLHALRFVPVVPLRQPPCRRKAMPSSGGL